MVRAKFTVTGITHEEAPHAPEKAVSTIHLSPVYEGSEENKEFFAYTPGGEITLGCANPSATAEFEQGKEYYVDFTPAPAPTE